MLPIKARLIQVAYEWDRPFKATEIAEVLGKEYPNEKTATAKAIEGQLEMYCRVDMVKATNVALDANGELDITYQITKVGKETAKKYVPGVK